MEKGLLKNIFLDTKNNLNLKGYLLTVFSTVIFSILPYYFFIKTSDIKIEKIGIDFWSVMLSVIFVWTFIFKGKVSSDKKNILRFITNNILILGALIFIDGAVIEKLSVLINTAFSERNIIFLMISYFLIRVKDVFIFFTAVSGILALIGNEKISFIESGKIFKNSIGKLFTFLFFWVFYTIYAAGCIDLTWFIFNISYIEHINLNEIFVYIGVFLNIYIFYFILVFVLSVFKNYLEKPEDEENAGEKITLPAVFEKTINALKGRKFKFYGTIAGIYLLCGAGVTAVVYLAIISGLFSFILIVFAVILGIATAIQIFITKFCFKFMGDFTEKINFSKFMKIYGCAVIVTILTFIAGIILESILSIISEDNYAAVIFSNGINGFIVFYAGVIQTLMTAFILKNQKGIIKKSFKESLKFFSLKFIFVLFGIYNLTGMIMRALEKIRNSYDYEVMLRGMVHFPSHIIVFLAVFIFLHTMILAVVTCVIEEKNIEF
ncbi:hypothetical protein HUW86_05870 [Fusobacterium sp. SB021]|uniref:hypothetical protein n=1 Tax=Fusobacterium sp. SB021 TaxID=2744227 RepID=UPI003CEDEBE1